MGLVRANIELVNIVDVENVENKYIKEDAVRSVKINVLVDSGAYMLAINEKVQQQLGLRKKRVGNATLANGEIVKLDIVGPVQVLFENRETICEAIVLPGNTDVLLGAIPMEGLDVVINPLLQTLTVNPESPDIASTSLKRFRK